MAAKPGLVLPKRLCILDNFDFLLLDALATCRMAPRNLWCFSR